MTTSERRQEANRRNALASTGPRTPGGKARSSLNATKHGLYAHPDLILEGEDPQAYETLRSDLRADLQPVGCLEEALADTIASMLWRLLRASRIEVGIYSHERLNQLADTERRSRIKPRKPDRLSQLLWQGGSTVTDQPSKPRTPTQEQIDRIPALHVAGLFEQNVSIGDSLRRLEDSEARLRRHLRNAISDLQNLQYIRRKREEGA